MAPKGIGGHGVDDFLKRRLHYFKPQHIVSNHLPEQQYDVVVSQFVVRWSSVGTNHEKSGNQGVQASAIMGNNTGGAYDRYVYLCGKRQFG
jgi:hypothetical protein